MRAVFFPSLDEEVTVGGLAISAEAGRVAVEEAGERPYGQAIERLRRHHGIRLSKRFLEKLTQMVGEFWLQGDDGDAVEQERGRAGPSGAMLPERRQLPYPPGSSKRIHHRLAQTAPQRTARESGLKYHSYVAAPPGRDSCQPGHFFGNLTPQRGRDAFPEVQEPPCEKCSTFETLGGVKDARSRT